MKPLILGSQSPRRKEILEFFSLPFTQVSPDFDELSIPFANNPQEYVYKLAAGKSASIQSTHSKALILAADTIVYKAPKLYNKPLSEVEAFEAINELQGKWHSVFTALSLRYKQKEVHAVEETKVLFNSLTPAMIKHYHSKIQWADKAGGYAIQMGGGLIVKRIEGCYYNVMGLPINTLCTLLRDFGIELWDYVK